MQFLDLRAATLRCFGPDAGAAEEKYLSGQCRYGNGPTHYLPSPKKMMFAVEDLDAWIATWTKREAREAKADVVV